MATKKRRSRKKQTVIDIVKKNFTNIIVVVSIFNIVVYTAGCMYMKFERGVEPSSTLTMCFFAVFGVELGSLAGIKMSKIRHSGTEVEEIADYAENHTQSER